MNVSQKIGDASPNRRVGQAPASFVQLSDPAITGVGGLKELLNTLRWQAHWILGSSLLCFLLGLLYVLFVSSKYTATAELLIETQQQQITASNPLFSGLTADVPLVNSQIELINSKRVVEMALHRLVLIERNKKAGKDKAWGLLKNIDLTNPEISIPYQVKREFSKRLDVKRKGLTYLVLVSYTDKDPEQAARATNALVESYFDYQKQTKRKFVITANNWLRERIISLGNDVKREEESVRKYEIEHGLLSIAGMTLREREFADTLDQLITTRTKAAHALARLRLVEKVSKNPVHLTSIGEVLKSPIIKDYRLQLSKIQSRLAKIVKLYGNKSDNAAILQAQIKDIKAGMHSEVQRIIREIHNGHEILSDQVKIMEQELNKVTSQMGKSSRNLVKLAKLKRQAKATGKLYMSLLIRSKETRAQEHLQQLDIRSVSVATPPPQASAPNKKLILALALFSGIAISMLTSIILGHTRPLLREAVEIEASVGIETLVTLPNFGPETIPLFPGILRKPGSKNIERHILSHANTPYTQAMFTMLNAIDKLNTEHPVKIVTIVSARNGEGRSTTAVNLADYAALCGRKILLVDADLRTFALTSELADDGQQTLLDALEDNEIPEDFAPVEGQRDFWFCPAPSAGECERPMNVLATGNMKRWLKKARDEFDLIVMDSPPLLSHVDAQSLVGHSDLVLYTVPWGEISPDGASKALERARIPNNTSVMAILNNAVI